MAVQISGNDITVPRDGTFSRNVSIAGTLTYEDVTNVDSIGLVTARNGIEVGASPGVAASISVDGNMIVSGISTFGGDVQVPDKIIHSGDTDTAIRFPSADTITSETGGSERFRINSEGITIKNSGAGGGVAINALGTTSEYGLITANANRSSENDILLGVGASWNGDSVAEIDFRAGDDTTNKDNGKIMFYTQSNNSGGLGERLRIGSEGQLGIAGANYGTSGQVLQSQGSGSAVQWATPAGATSGTYTSFGTGYYVDITTTSTNIVKYDILFTGVSCGGGTDWQFQLGDSGGIENSGYEVVACYRSHNSSNNTNNRSDGFRWHGTGSSGFIMDGKFSLTRIHNNKWFGEGQLVRTEAGSTLYDMWGTKELSGALTTIHISASSDDSEVFDGGYFKVIEYTGTV